jgi:hypothetical protein
MKKLATVLFGLLVIGLTSCSTCQTCDCTGSVEEICQSDYDTKAQYDAIIELSEALGCECS